MWGHLFFGVPTSAAEGGRNQRSAHQRHSNGSRLYYRWTFVMGLKKQNGPANNPTSFSTKSARIGKYRVSNFVPRRLDALYLVELWCREL